MSAHNDSHLAAAFATLVCAWVVTLVSLSLAGAPAPDAGPGSSSSAAAVARR